MRGAISKRALRDWVSRLAAIHYSQCPHGYMLCKCEFSAILREMIKAAEDLRGAAIRKRLREKVEKTA